MHLLLVSTYELGHQPIHLASPAAALRRAGHRVSTVDVSVDPLQRHLLDGVDAVAVSVPMHTAARLAGSVIGSVRSWSPDLPVAVYGLYASEGDLSGSRFVGEYEPALVAWADDGAPPRGTVVSIANGSFRTPDRSGLPAIDRYAHLERDGIAVPAGSVEGSHGCRHRCRHCPIPAIYDGRYRIVDRDAVLEDVATQVDAGIGHLTWGDPDFLNGPRHSLDLIEEVHRRHPHLTHDVTIKVEHLLRFPDAVRRLAAAGVLFVVSAFESTDDRTLGLLDKGHTVADMRAAVTSVRGAGIDIHPSWMPFVPWTTPSDVVGIFEFLAEHDLMGSTDPVQMSIRLLIPRDSLMLHLDEVTVSGYDEAALSWEWTSTDPASDALQTRLAARAEKGGDPIETLVDMWGDALEAAGRDRGEAAAPTGATRGRPRLTESWFCCAEPTAAQSLQVGPGANVS